MVNIVEARLLLPPDLRTPEIIQAFNNKPIQRPEVWPAKRIEALSQKEKVDELLLDFGLAATPIIWDIADRGIGRESIGEVRGRENEDIEITMDRISERVERRILEKLAQKYSLSFFVFSEHESFMVGESKYGEEPELVMFLDPWDNSVEHKMRLGDTPGFMVGGMWRRQDGQAIPMGAVQSNLYTQHLFINRDNENYEYNPRIDDLRVFPPTPIIENIDDGRFILISYDGKDKYIRKFNENLDSLNRDRNPNSIFHGKAGAHGYAYQAWNGGIYVIRNEPLSEGPAGWPFALSRGFRIQNIREDGELEDCNLNLDYYLKNPELYAEDRIPWLLVSNNPKISGEVLRYMFNKPLDQHARLS